MPAICSDGTDCTNSRTNYCPNFSCPNSRTKNSNEAFQLGNFGFYELIICTLTISSILHCHRICRRPLLLLLLLLLLLE